MYPCSAFWLFVFSGICCSGISSVQQPLKLRHEFDPGCCGVTYLNNKEALHWTYKGMNDESVGLEDMNGCGTA